MSTYDHYENYEWLGIFWTPDQSIEFAGKLTYSPEDGIELEFLYPMSEKKIDKTNHIYGALENGEPCTLFGSFNPDRFGFHVGKVSIYKGKIQFRAVLFGEHSSPEDRFDGLWLDLTNFQEFCYPQEFKDSAKYSKKPIQKATKENLTISLINSGRFKFSSNTFSNLFHCDNKEVTEEITCFFESLKEKYPEDLVHVRNDIGWIFEVRSRDGFTIEDIENQTYSSENLLSLLVYSPIRRKKISAMKKSDISTGKFEGRPLLTSIFDIDKFKIKVLKRNLIHYNLPISATNSNIAELFSKWKDLEEGCQIFTGIISNRFGRSYQHQLYAEIILNLTKLESISYSLGAKANNKYTLALITYASTEIMNLMKSYFSVSDNEKLGKSLTDLRAEVAHVGKPPKHLKNLSTSNLIGISRSIEIVIASHIYEQLGISSQQIEAFQEARVRSLPIIRRQ